MTIITNPQPNPLAATIQAAWQIVLPPISEIIKLGMDEGFTVPFYLNAVAHANRHENYHVFVLQIDHSIVDWPRSDVMICGTAPIVKGQFEHPKPPALPILIFLFDRDHVKHVRARLVRLKPNAKRRLLKFDGSRWRQVWIEP
jgi:hypothetical protein